MADLKTMESLKKGLDGLKTGVNIANAASVKGKNIKEGIKNKNDAQLADGIASVASVGVKAGFKAAGKEVPYVGDIIGSKTVKDGVKNGIGMAKGEKTFRDTSTTGHTLDAVTEGASDVVGTAAGVFISAKTAGIVNSEYVRGRVVSPNCNDLMKNRDSLTQTLPVVKMTVEATRDVVNVAKGNIFSERVHDTLTGETGMLSPLVQKAYQAMYDVHGKTIGKIWPKTREEKKMMKSFNDFCDKLSEGTTNLNNKAYEKLYKKGWDKMNKVADRVNDCVGQLYVDGLDKMKGDNEVSLEAT